MTSARWGTSSQELDCRPPDLEEPRRRTRAEGERHVSESLGRGDLRKRGELSSDEEFGTRSADRDERRFVERIGGSTADTRGRSEFGTAGRTEGEFPSDRLGLVKIEAVSFAEALKEIRRRFGDDVSIVHTRVIRRKGMLGVLGATGVDVYVTGRSEFEAWRGHADDRSLRGTLEPKSRSADLGLPSRTVRSSAESASHLYSSAKADRTPPQDESSQMGSSQFGPGPHFGENTLFGPVPTPRAESGPLPGNVGAGRVPISPGYREPEEVVAALERLSKKIGDVMANRAGPDSTSLPTVRPRSSTQPVEGSAMGLRSGSQESGLTRGNPRAEEAQHDEGLPARASQDPAPETEPTNSGGTHPVVAAAKRMLEEWGVSSVTATELLGRLSRRSLPRLSGDLRECRQLAKLSLRELIRPKLPPARPIPRPERARRRLVTLVGPTGVGKTTTLAKLGALFSITEHAKVGFVTLDTYRIGAVDQLRRYADIIRVPLEVVTPETSLHQAIDRLGDAEVILIDTAGRSQKDADRIHELREMLSEIGDLDVHLCLALSASPEAILAAAENFRVVGYSRLLITKLDEAYRHGVLLDLFARAKTPVSYLTTGQEVPDDIHPATLERLEDLILGED